MKIIYLTEGPHDGTFISKILVRSKVCKVADIWTFKNSGTVDGKRKGETNVIRSFMKPSSPHSVLIKVENGKHFLLQLFNSICVNVMIAQDPPPKLVVIFDHDKLSVDKEFENIRQHIKSSKNGMDFVKLSRIDRNNIAHSSVYQLVKITDHHRIVIANIHFFCFFTSLEKKAKKLFGKYHIDDLIDKMSQIFKADDIFGV